MGFRSLVLPHSPGWVLKTLPPGLVGQKVLCKVRSHGAGTLVGTSGAKHVALGAHVVGVGPVLLAGTCLPDPLTRGLSSCPQILELLCQILQTDSLSAIQFWLLYAPPKGEDTAGAWGFLGLEAVEGLVLWISLGSHPQPSPWAAAPFWSPKLAFSSKTVPLLPAPAPSAGFPHPCFSEGASG